MRGGVQKARGDKRLCRGKELYFNPTGLAAVKKFIRFNGGGERLQIGEYRRRIDDVGANEIDELRNIFAVIAVALGGC